jgi:hypothetical protein
MLIHPSAKDFDGVLAMAKANKSTLLKGAPAPVVVASGLSTAGTNPRVILVLPDSGFTAVEEWASRLEAGCSARADRASAVAQLAHEKANPAGVVDLALLHSLGQQISYDDEVIASYRPWAGEDFPVEVCK